MNEESWMPNGIVPLPDGDGGKYVIRTAEELRRRHDEFPPCFEYQDARSRVFQALAEIEKRDAYLEGLKDQFLFFFIHSLYAAQINFRPLSQRLHDLRESVEGFNVRRETHDE